MTALSDSESKEKLLGSSNAEGLLKLLKEAIEHAAEVIEEFRQKSGMAKRLLKYKTDADAFKEAQERLGDRMTVRMPNVLPHTQNFSRSIYFVLQGLALYLSAIMQKQVSDQFDRLLAEVNEATRQVGVKVDEVGGKVDAGFDRNLEKMESLKLSNSPLPSQGFPKKLRHEWLKIFATATKIDWEDFIGGIKDPKAEMSFSNILAAFSLRLTEQAKTAEEQYLILAQAKNAEEQLLILAKSAIVGKTESKVRSSKFKYLFER